MPSPPSRRAAAADDLQARIDAAEQAVIRRDARVRQHLQALGDGLQRLAAPKHLLSMAGGLLLAGLLRPRRASEPDDRAEPRRGVFGFALQLLLPLVSGWLRGRARRRPG